MRDDGDKHDKKHLYSWNEIPEWQRDNEYIYHGYVKETNSFYLTLGSLFYLHNESVNIYSHLIPGLTFLCFTLFFNAQVIPVYKTTGIYDYAAINLFFIGAFCCLTLSSAFHCLKSHSLTVATFGNKLDYLGIVILISTSMISLIYFGFHDNPIYFYSMSLLTLTFGFLCGVVSLKDKFRSNEYRVWRASLFVAFGLSGTMPVLLGIIKLGAAETWHRVQVKWVLLEAFFYIFGAFLYGARIPEKFAPGSFDIWGHSHQLFHILVVIAAGCHLTALMGSYQMVHQQLGAIL